jgi:hypothetical protein
MRDAPVNPPGMGTLDLGAQGFGGFDIDATGIGKRDPARDRRGH